MSQPRVVERLLIYRTLSQRNVLALSVELTEGGKVTFVPGDERSQEAQRMLEEGVESRGVHVTPDQGGVFLRAVYDMLQRATVWHAVRDTSVVSKEEPGEDTPTRV